MKTECTADQLIMFLLTAVMLFAWSANATASQEGVEAVGAGSVTPRLWTNIQHPVVFAAHVCDSAGSVDDCAEAQHLPLPSPALYVSIGSPIAQLYKVYVVVSDPSGTVSFMTLFDNLNVSCGPCIWSWKFTHAGLDALPDGDYNFTALVIGQTDGRAARTHSYYFHK